MRLSLALSVWAALLMSSHFARAETRLPGVWQERQYTFSQVGMNSVYSCQGLARKLTLLLRASGAHEDVRVAPLACGAGEPNLSAKADLTFFTLVPAGRHQPRIGTWRSVTLTPNSPRELSAGDCELVEGFRDQLLPMFVTRGVVDRVRCVPGRHGGFDLRFQVFTTSPTLE